MRIGNRARVERIAAGLKLRELAVAAGIAASALSEFENDLRELSPEQERRRRAVLDQGAGIHTAAVRRLVTLAEENPS